MIVQDDSQLLAAGASVDNFLIERVLGQGSFGNTYLATDRVLGGKHVLKEFAPASLVNRNPNGTLSPKDETAALDFHAGQKQFLTEGRILAGLQHPNVISVSRCFQANNTAYLQMPYYRGEPLSSLLQRDGPFNQDQLKSLLSPLLNALEYLHQHSVFHQDIKPDNIYITENGEPLLLDFGAARQDTAATPTVRNRQLSPGYAALEQEQPSSPIGPWTDIYGLAASLYRISTGKLPVAASKRQESIQQGLPDPLKDPSSLVSPSLPKQWLQAISAGLELDQSHRPRSIAAWRPLFGLNNESKAGKTVTRRSVLSSQPEAKFASEGRPWLPMVLLAAFAVVLVGLIYFLLAANPKEEVNGPESISDSDDTVNEPVSRDPEENRRWMEALEADSVYAYRRFLQDYPVSIHEAGARQHLARLDDSQWGETQAEDTRSAYEAYLELFPQGQYEPDAMIKLDAFKRTESEADRQEALRLEQDDLLWNEARQKRSISALDQYLEEFPAGKHVTEAQKLRRELSDIANDSTAFEAAQKLNTKSSYQSYIDAFPRGVHVTEALTAIDGLTLRPGRLFRDCDLCPDLVMLASGTFWQGAEENSESALANEKPRRKVVIKNAFAIGIHEVTMAQWDACVEDGGCTTTPTDNGWGRNTRPVIMVSWNDAQAYSEWLSKKTGEAYRLPTESEWEYAARAGETAEWPADNPAKICDQANIAGSETGFRWAHTLCADSFALETAPTGSFSANFFGLFDTIGNVAEWTLDCMSLSYMDSPADGSANSRGLCNSRVTRGGSWFSGARESRLTARFNLKAGDRNDFTGFRVVRELPRS